MGLDPVYFITIYCFYLLINLILRCSCRDSLSEYDKTIEKMHGLVYLTHQLHASNNYIHYFGVS